MTNIVQTLLQRSRDRASAYWSQWQDARDRSRARYVDWGDHPTILGLIQRRVFGNGDTTIFDFLRTHFPAFAHARALSLCCGDGGFEKQLVANGVFGSVVGMDLSPARVEAANRCRDEYAARLEYVVADANRGEFGNDAYDIVFAKAALHHIENLDALLGGITRCLRPGGHLVTIDFFGPTRFQWSDAQLDAANDFLATEVPADLLRKPDGSLHRNIRRPTVQEVIDSDPSEAVRSGELLDWIRDHFSVEKDFAIGGTLLNLIFDGSIVNNFDPNDMGHNQIIEKAFVRETDLMARGEIGCDFRFMIARCASRAA